MPDGVEGEGVPPMLSSQICATSMIPLGVFAPRGCIRYGIPTQARTHKLAHLNNSERESLLVGQELRKFDSNRSGVGESMVKGGRHPPLTTTYFLDIADGSSMLFAIRLPLRTSFTL